MSPMSNQINTCLFLLHFFVIQAASTAIQNETIEFSSNQEVFVGEDAVFKWSLNENLAKNIADIKFGIVTRPERHGERLDAILVKTFPSMKIKWNLVSSYVRAYVNRTEVIQNVFAGFKIKKVGLNDTSEYYCTVRRTGESQTMVTDYVKLKVIDIQVLNETSSNEVVSWKGHKIRLHCTVRIVPNTLKKFIWRNRAKSGTIVDPSKQHDTANGTHLVVLTYEDADFGPYECIAMTPTTQQSHFIRIKRIYEPSEPGNFSQNRRLIKRLNCTAMVELSWMSPLKDGGAPLTHYVVEYKPFGQEWSKASRHLVVTSHIKICRPPRDQGGDGLHVRVKAKNKVGVGKPSPAAIVTFWDVPTAPINLKSHLRRNLGDPFVELTWDYPLHDGGVPVSTYQVEYKPLVAAWSNAASVQTVEKQINIWKTSQDVEIYHVRVSAVNGVGFGETSNILKVAFADVPSKPLEVVEKTVLHAKQTIPHIHIVWRRPVDNGGLKVTHYRIEYKIVAQRGWKLAKSDLVEDEEYVIEHVNKNKEYEVRVSAKNDMGFGPWSKPAVVKYKEKSFVAFKARSRGSKPTHVNNRVLILVFLLVTNLALRLPR